MRLILLSSLVLLASCSLFQSKAPINSEHSKEVPAWAYAPMEGCVEERELCASGEGPTSALADANAMKALAAIFETRIEAVTTSSMTATGSGAFAQAQESAAVSVRDEVKQTLEAAQVEKRHRHKKLSYSLVSLDKAKASGNLRAAMDKVQAELEGLWKRKDRTGWARMWELFHQREGLNDRYNIINGARVSFSPSVKELQDWYQSRRAETPIGFDAQGLTTELLGALKARLTNSGYRLFDLTTGARLKARLEAKQEHMNVDGFEKWFFVLTLENISKAGAKIGGLSVQETATGRSKADCEMKARESLLKMMEARLSELNLQD